MSLWEERVARNEALFRYVNERIEELVGDSDVADFVCECSDAACVDRITVPLGVYEETRANPRAFLLVPGHERTEIETVQAVSDAYVVVEKRDLAGSIAERTDPR